MRNHQRDIEALVRSGHVEAGGALPISQRVQTSGRSEPAPPRWSPASERAQRILGRAFVEGGEARRCALALWLTYAYGTHPTPALTLGLGVVLATDEERHATVRHWWLWGTGGSADELAVSGVELLGRAVGWYETASEEPGCAGALAQLVSAADAVRCEGGVVERLREWHAAWVAARELCGPCSKKVRCRGLRPQREPIVTLPRCIVVEPPRPRPVCAPSESECGTGWLAWDLGRAA